MTEAEVSKQLEQFFTEYGWEYRKEWVTKSGKAIDFLVKAPYDDGYIFFGVECKKDLINDNATVLADHLEQASAYSRDLDMPVFLAPIVSGSSINSFYHGGNTITAISALNIFGGRFNVGCLIKQERWYGGAYHQEWFMIMRGGAFWDSKNGFNKSRLHMVGSTGSEKIRRDIKIWK
jgi:hypothetical protein